MSVKTTADEHLNAALEKIQGAVKDISEIVVNHCCGYDEYNSPYHEALKRSMMELMEIRDRLQ